jgi:putative intracellular protease/amidase
MKKLNNALVLLVAVSAIYISDGSRCNATSAAGGRRAAQKESQDQRKPATKNLAIFIFNGVQIIDYTGPYEVFGHAWDADKDQELFNVYTVAEKTDPITTWMGMTVVPKYTFENAPKADIVLLPGGDTHLELKNPKAIKWVKDRAGEAEYIMSVCNGAFFLAEAGLLDGKTATTYYALIDALKADAPKAKVVIDQRFTDNGKIITTAGLSSGIDGALHLIDKIAGRGEAQRVALNMEYNWQPDSGYARASFADRYLRKIVGREDDFKLPKGTSMKILGQQGDRESWEKQWWVRTDLSVEALSKVINARLGERWTNQSTKSVNTVSGTTWTFKGEDGQTWSAFSKIQPVNVGKNKYKLTIRLAQGDNSAGSL